MRPTHENEIVFEGALEARVAAQLLTDAGRSDLLEAIEPAIEPPTIGKLAFLAALGNEQNGRGDSTEYVCKPSVSADVVRTLVNMSEPTDPDRQILSRKKFMGQMLVGFTRKLASLPERHRQDSIVEVSGMTIFGVSDEQADLMKRREAFINRYLAEQGLTMEDLSVDQILDIRKQPGWQNPPAIS